MLHGILQKIDQHLLNQKRIHRNGDKLIRHIDRNVNAGIAALHLMQGGVNQLLQHRRRLAQRHAVSLNPRHGQKIFHHVDKPLALRLHIPQKPQLLFTIQHIVVFNNGAGGTVNGGQRRAQIVRNGTQKRGAHFLLLPVDSCALLPLERRHEQTGEKGHHGHDYRTENALLKMKVENIIGHGKGIIEQKKVN